jgi:hypothetical protein
MGLYPTPYANNTDLLPDNTTQQISPLDHRTVNEAIILYCGAAQVYAFPAEADNPGTPENPRAYIALPGTYPNFGNLTVSAPLGILFWNGTAWSVINLTMPSPHEYRRCKLNEAIVAAIGTTTDFDVDMINGGWAAKAGQWVQLINRRTGDYDFCQLAADITASTTNIQIVPRIIQKNFNVGSIVEIDSSVNMKWYGIELTGIGTNFVTVPSSWRLPPLQAIDPNVWYDLLQISVNGMQARWQSTPVGPFDYNVVNDATRLKIYFANNLSTNDKVIVRLYQPRVLAITA